MKTTTSKPRIWVFSGARPSNGAKELAANPGFLRLRTDRFHKVKPQDLICNWGVSDPFMPVDLKNPVLNEPQDIKKATDKLQAFWALENGGVSIVPFTDDTDEALKWCQSGWTVVVRKKLTGHSGDGILIIEKGSVSTLCDMKDYQAPLYTRYIFKIREFRVHVVMGKVVDTQQKIKDPNQNVKTWKVRSHANGFIFARNNLQECPARNAIAIDACKALGLDFGAVDIIEDKNGNLYVLEVNTAPGLEGQTIQSYAKAIKDAFAINGD